MVVLVFENREELLSGLEGGVGMTGRVRSRYTPGRVWSNRVRREFTKAAQDGRIEG